jgi:hypothetical protein
MDIALGQEEEEARANAKKPSSAYEASESDRNFEYDSTFDQNLGTRIGHVDPFKYAYIQPALRANPRAKPEQPFPPGQLGREEVLMGHGSSRTEDDYCHAGATVRLKSLHQQDRRLVNRWWNDQLQSCGEQNLLAVLIGEESGTLILGRTANLIEMSTSSKELV